MQDTNHSDNPKARVLLVDDEDFVRDAGSAMIRMLGYEADAVSSGQEAVERVRAGDAPYDIIVIDLSMPDMSGEECFRILRREAEGAKLLITSGYVVESRVALLREEGLDGVLQKPFTLDSIRTTFEQVLE